MREPALSGADRKALDFFLDLEFLLFRYANSSSWAVSSVVWVCLFDMGSAPHFYNTVTLHLQTARRFACGILSKSGREWQRCCLPEHIRGGGGVIFSILPVIFAGVQQPAIVQS